MLGIEDIGTHQPTDNLIGDTLHEGFDTHGESLSFSKFHLEQFIDATRKVVDATVLSGDRPDSKRYRFNGRQIIEAHTSQNTTRPERRGTRDHFDFLDPQKPAYLEGFETVPETGWYRIVIRCTAKDRGRYDSESTGIYDEDPIRLSVRLGDRERVFELPDDESTEIELKEWIAEGTRLRLYHPTDGLRMRGNGNFKFQNAITGEYLMQHDRPLYDQVVANIKPQKSGRVRQPRDWHNWVDHWMGPRPRVYGVTVEGPFYESWPPERQIALLGEDPKAENAKQILQPIAERAWRREIGVGELDEVAQLVQQQSHRLGDVEAIKEGIIAVLSTPAFLLINQQERSPEDRFASKISFFLSSTIPNRELLQSSREGKLDTYDGVLRELNQRLEDGQAEPLMREFPFAWLKLNDINFMAPDPDRYRHYHRKRVSEDMVEEALHFFRAGVHDNVPLTEFLSADYSYINADLARVYDLDDVPQDSTFRKYTFTDGRRGGLLGMGAFLTVTADSLGNVPHPPGHLLDGELPGHSSVTTATGCGHRRTGRAVCPDDQGGTRGASFR